MIGQAPGNGINGDYDGSYRTRKSLKYKRTVGDVDLYASYLFSDDYNPNNGLRYKRKGGGSLGVDYHITDDLTQGYGVELHPCGNAWRHQQNLRSKHRRYRTELETGQLDLLNGRRLVSKLHDHQKVSVNDYFAGDAEVWNTSRVIPSRLVSMR